jgi:lipoprotein-releasing system permease protein
MISSFGAFLVTTLVSLRKSHAYARARLIRSAILVALVMIPLILALIFMDGMMRGITDKYITLQDGHVQLYAREVLHDNPEDFSQYDNRIIRGDFVVSGYGIIYSRDTTAEVRIKGVDPSYFSDVRTAQMSLTGNPVEKAERLVAITLSEALAKQLGVSIGDRVACMVVPDSSTSVVRPILAQVTSLYQSGYHELDTSLVFMNRSDALRFFPQEKNGYTELLVDPTAVDDLTEIIEEIQENQEKRIPYATWDSFNTTVYTNFITSRQVILLVFMMILLVAGVYVASIAQELVQDSMQAIALYKTLGARNRTLYWAFFITVMAVTLSGMIGGTTLGVLLALRLGTLLQWLSNTGLAGLQYYLLDFPVVVSVPDILLICTAMLIISSVTVHLSLRRIRKISPLQLLQQD